MEELFRRLRASNTQVTIDYAYVILVILLSRRVLIQDLDLSQSKEL